MSNRMTFSLASIILIFALAFAAMPAMAADGGPTITIAKYSGKTDPNDATSADYTLTRADFRVKITFSPKIQTTGAGALEAGEVMLQAGNASGLVGSLVAATGLVAVQDAGGTPTGVDFVATFPTIDNAATEVVVTIAADVANGGTLDNILGNQAGYQRLTLPPVLGDVEVTVSDPKAVSGTAGAYTVTFTFGDGTTAPTTTFAESHIKITPKAGATAATPVQDSDAAKAGTYTSQIQLIFGTPSVTVGVEPGYAKQKGASVTLPPPPTADQNPPAAMIEVSGHDAAERTYRISVTFTPAADSLGNAGEAIDDFGFAKLDIKDGSTPPAAVITTLAEAGSERVADNSYLAILKYDRLSTLPLTIKVDQDELETSNPDESAMVGEAGPPPAMDEPPAVSIKTSDHKPDPIRTFQVDVTLIPGLKADGKTPGDAITGFGLSNLKITDAGDVVVTATVVDERAADNSYVAILQYNPLDALPLTVTTADDYETSNEDDDPAATAMVPPTGTPGPTPTPPGAPGAPTGLTATPDQAADTVMLSWTAPADDGGSAITGYMIDQTGAAAASYTATASPFTTPALAAGDYTFTVKAENTNGTGPASNQAMATIDPATPPVANNPPSFRGEEIKDIVIWKGHAYMTIALPLATDDETDTLKPYKVEDAAGNPLPAGLSLKANDAQERFIQGTATAAVAETKYYYIATDSMGATDKIDFNITVLDPIKPTAPTGVTAEEEGAVEDPTITPRTVNTNKVVVNWTAPVDTTDTSHDPAIPFGSAITGYKVSYTNQAGNKETDPVSGADVLTYMTPVLARGEYTFQVQAINGVGDGEASPLEHLSHVAIVADPPGPPRNLSAALVPNSQNVTLNWLPPLDNGGAPITNYRIYVTDNGLGRTVQSPIFPNVQTVQIQNLAPGQYVFRVSAINMDGEGNQSYNTTPPTNVPAAPVTPGNNPPVWESNASIASISGTVGMPITPQTLPSATDDDRDTITYSVSPTLPAGLRFNTTTRYLSGTPAAAVTPARTYTYMASDGKGGSISLNFTIQVVAPIPPRPATIEIPTSSSSSPVIPLPNVMIPAHGYVVLVRDVTESGTYTPTSWIREVAMHGLPDLDLFFRNGGTIALNGPGVQNQRDVVISEIMWGSDSSLAEPEYSQWIEFYNTTPSAISLSSFSIQFHRADVPATAWTGYHDLVANSGFHVGYWQVPGQSGRTNPVDTQGRFAQTVTLHSMYRNINYARVENPAYVGNRGERLKDFPGGTGSGSWKKSEAPNANIGPQWMATPGAPHQIRFTAANSTFGRRVIISEIGNSSNDAYDWIELYNTTDGTINLRKWDVTRIENEGGVGKEYRLFQFPDNDSIQLPAKSFLVIAASNPKSDGNDLAAGIDITKSDIDQVNTGLGSKVGIGHQANNTTAYYYVNSGAKLPNNNNRRLIVLRTANDKHGQPTHAEDFMGTLSIALNGELPPGWTGYDANARKFYTTSTWPFQGVGGRHGNVIDGTGDEDFRPGRVIQRNDFGNGIGEKDLAVRGYTGIGYDVHAAVNGENGGTPGYHKDAIKADKSDWAGQISISEIMLATEEREGEDRVRLPRATKLPQWFEIYNASLTEAVNLNNWYLEIQNDDSGDLRVGGLVGDVEHPRNLHGTLRLPNVTVQPNQTVLIVSASGPSSGDFPEQRMVNLFTNGTYRSILNLRARGDSVFSQEGFYIQLRDHKGNHVDEIGNLGVSRRATVNALRRDNFDGEWFLTNDGTAEGTPILHSGEGYRTSLIRVYNNGKPGLRENGRAVSVSADESPGLMRNGWLQASRTNFLSVTHRGESYYGNRNDFGTPGYRGGGPLPVSLSKFRPERQADGSVVIKWVTESELNNAGFNILRAEDRDGEYTKVNAELIDGYGTTSERHAYEWKDTTAKPNVVYYYQIQDVSFDGQVQNLRVSRLKGNVSAEGKATTTWGSLKSQD